MYHEEKSLVQTAVLYILINIGISTYSPAAAVRGEITVDLDRCSVNVDSVRTIDCCLIMTLDVSTIPEE